MRNYLYKSLENLRRPYKDPLSGLSQFPENMLEGYNTAQYGGTYNSFWQSATIGATGRSLAGCFDSQGRGAVVNASRSLICAHKKAGTEDFVSAAREEALRMREDLRQALRG